MTEETGASSKPPQTQDASDKGDSGRSAEGNSGNGGRNGRRNNRYAYGGGMSKHITYAGENEDIGVLLTLRDEVFSKRVVYSAFAEKIKNYVTQNFQYAKDIVPIIETLEDTRATVVAEQPLDLVGNDLNSPVLVAMKTEEVKKHIRRISVLEENKVTLYGVVWGQCSTALQELIKTDPDFEKRDKDFDSIWLLKKCKLVSSGVDDRANKYNTLLKAITQMCNIRQQPYESNDSYRTRLDALVLTLELSGGKHMLCSDELIEPKDPDQPTEQEIKDEEEKMKAMILIVRADPNRFSALQSSLEEGVFLNRDEYPTTVTTAYELLQKTCPEVPGASPSRGWRFGRNKGRNKKSHEHSALSFAQHKEGLVPGRDGKTHAHVVYFSCNKPGHYKNQCPSTKDVSFAQFVLSQNKTQIINPNWLLLDSGSTVTVCSNPKLVHNIQPCGSQGPLRITTNGGGQSFYEVADLNILPMKVHFNKDSMANIL